MENISIYIFEYFYTEIKWTDPEKPSEVSTQTDINWY